MYYKSTSEKYETVAQQTYYVSVSETQSRNRFLSFVILKDLISAWVTAEKIASVYFLLT